MSRMRLLLIWLMLMCGGAVTAQDPQFSQFYAAPLYLNPAMAGSSGQARAGINYRNQWPAIDANFTTTSVFFDYYIADKRSGVGFILTQDREGLAGLRSLSVGLQYSYELRITDKLGFTPGFQAAFYTRDVNFSKLTFGDQYDPTTGNFINPQTAEQFNSDFQKNFFDLSVGGLLFTPTSWLGVTVNHLTQPNQSIIDEDAPLPMKFSVHGGVKIRMRPGVVGSGVYARSSERSVSPAFQYRHQGEFDQLDLGLYFTLEPLVLGTWYRGVPYKKVDDIQNNESIVFLIGFTKIGGRDKNGNRDGLTIGYSFDYTISELGIGSGGAHEFSLVYTWPMRNPRKPPPDKMVIPCPDF